MNEHLLNLVKDLIEVLNKHYPYYHQLKGSKELVFILLIHNKINRLNNLALNFLYPDRPRKDITVLKVEDFETWKKLR